METNKLAEDLRAKRLAERDARSSLSNGARVCIVGQGMDAPLHVHGTVTRVTSTLVIIKTSNGTVRRFGVEDGHSKPRKPYGGSSVHPTCQRPKH